MSLAAIVSARAMYLLSPENLCDDFELGSCSQDGFVGAVRHCIASPSGKSRSKPELGRGLRHLRLSILTSRLSIELIASASAPLG
jgi:hypothetical protein